MTYAELIHAVKLLLPNQPFAVYVEYWDHPEPHAHESLNWKIWDAKRNEHFEGKTPEAALQLLQNEIAKPSLYDGLAAVVAPAVA